MRALCTLTALFALFCHTAQAASFDCNKRPARPAERLICESDSLSTLDEQLAVAYKAAMKTGSSDSNSSEVLKSSQQRWLRMTRDACKDKHCLEKAYVGRIAFLLQWNEDAPVDSKTDSKVDGNYQFSRDIEFMNGTHATMEDCLTVKSTGNAQARVDTVLVQGNGHTCSLSGKFAVVGNVYTYLPGKGDEDIQNCQIKLTVKRHQIVLSAAGEGCSSHCGARASFTSGASFLRTDKVKQACVAE
ncbi:lysozyme inhibitor LprI family protein [Undibacterium sp. TS12]|uniref:lysozyme inhibitor LprI family protein n=1 Tax=Undibacterium sp. TS12 TaxID=2908202 RepID=UPI001F4CBFF4|nr:lysozyme inhibitor LprI family protein [Undibacterium sp. TS12]MCH8622492.1 lysozyme inhibitor LprI family protein [Undibacterium sp. TS12]